MHAQATMLASAPDVALCAGNGFVVEVVNQVRLACIASSFIGALLCP